MAGVLGDAEKRVKASVCERCGDGVCLIRSISEKWWTVQPEKARHWMIEGKQDGPGKIAVLTTTGLAFFGVRSAAGVPGAVEVEGRSTHSEVCTARSPGGGR